MMCEITNNGMKPSVTFLKSKKNHRDGYGNLTYLMLAGHFCSWHKKFITNENDKKNYVKIKEELALMPRGLAQKYNKSEYGDYVYIDGKGYVLKNAFMKYIVFENR